MNTFEKNKSILINTDLLFQDNDKIIESFSEKIEQILLLDSNDIFKENANINKIISICYRTGFINEGEKIGNKLFQIKYPKCFKKLSFLELSSILEDLVSNFNYYIEKELLEYLNVKYRLKSPFSIKIKLNKKNINYDITKKEILEEFDDLIGIKILIDTDLFFKGIDKIIENIFLEKLGIKLFLKKDFTISDKINPPKIPMKNYSGNYKNIGLQIQILDKNFESAFYSSSYFIHKGFNIDNLNYNSLYYLYIRILYFYILNQKGLNYKDKLLLELGLLKKIHYYNDVIIKVLDFDYDDNIKKLYKKNLIL